MVKEALYYFVLNNRKRIKFYKIVGEKHIRIKLPNPHKKTFDRFFSLKPDVDATSEVVTFMEKMEYEDDYYNADTIEKIFKINLGGDSFIVNLDGEAVDNLINYDLEVSYPNAFYSFFLLGNLSYLMSRYVIMLMIYFTHPKMFNIDFEQQLLKILSKIYQ